MVKSYFRHIAKIMLIAFGINLLPISAITVFANPKTENVIVHNEEIKSPYGPYYGTYENKKAYDPFKDQIKDENQLKGYEYSKDTLLIKTKNKFRLFSKSGVSNNAIESMEMLDIFKSKQQTFTSKEEGTWFKAKLKENSNLEVVINELNQDNDVLAVEPEYIRKLETTIPTIETDAGVNEQWYLNSIGITDAWRHLEEQGISPGGSNDIVVAVIDTGVDYTHPDLVSNIWTNHQEIEGDGIDNDNNGYVDDVHGVTTVSGQQHEQPMDYNGHGTHVAGIIASEANNGLGGTGIAYNVKIMPIKAAQDGGVLSSSDVARAIIYAAENGADVINMSFGGYGRSTIEEDALAIAFSTSVLVAAAGNDGIANEVTLETQTGKPMFPAAYPWVLGVMASSPSANEKGDWVSNFSNWDINTQNSLEYELMAPGSKIYSTLPNNQYAKWDGTSMAAPVVSAIAALVRSKFNDKERYSSRFIMGQLASTGIEKQGKTYSKDKPPKKYKEVNALNALTQIPKPNVTYIEHYLFDKSEMESTTSGDGIVDAGESVDIGMVIRNHWGKAEDVNVTIDAVLPSGASDPYVEIINGTVNYGAIGNFGTDDNGFIYENDVVVGVNHPFTIKVKENAPNNHYVKLNVTITAKNGFDSGDTTIYSTKTSISFVTRKGTILPSVIDKDMTLTKDKYWIIPNATVIEQNATVNVEPGTQIQFWASEPEDPYAEKPMTYLQVKGNLFVNGTAEEPVEMFASSMWRGYEVKVFTGNEMLYYQDMYNNAGVGNVELNYVKISNPHINVNKINNCYFTQDEYNIMFKRYLQDGKVQTSEYIGPTVLAQEIKNSKFYKLGFKKWDNDTQGLLKVDGKLDGNIFDNCVYFFDEKKVENNVFLNNYKLNREQYGDREYWTSQGSNFGITVNKDAGFNITNPEKFNYTGSTYVGVNTSLYEFSYEEQARLVKEFAATLGGEIAEANDEVERYFIEDYLNRNMGAMFSNELLIEIPGISNVEYITLNHSKLELGAGGASNKLIANIYPAKAQNKNVSWVSSNPEIATVDTQGNITPLVEGTTTITATTEDGGHTATCEVIVKTIVPATGINLNKTELILEKGTSEQLISQILPSGATDKRVEWTSSNEAIVTVDKSGNIVAKELGSATVTATALDGNFKATCVVNVVVPVTGIKVDKELLRLIAGRESVKLNAQVTPDNASIKDVIWTTSDEEIVTVDKEGNVTPIKAGTVMITAKSKDGGFKKNIIVTVWEEEYSFNPIKIVAGEMNTVILNDDGSVWATGYNYKNTPIMISDVSRFEGKVIDISIGSNYNNKIYMLTDKGYVYEGYNIGAYYKIESLTGIKQIESGYEHLLALKNDGTVWAKGENNYGQLGDGSTNNSDEAIQVDGLTDIVDISAGYNSSAAVKSDGTLYTWGSNNNGMLGLGDYNGRLYPTKVNNINNAKEVEVNYNSIAYLSTNNKLYCAGYGTANIDITTFQYIDSDVVSVDASDNSLLYVKNNGNLYVTGSNFYGQLGIGNTEYVSGQILNKNITDVKSIHSGYEHNIIIKNDGSVYAMGKNNYGQLGNMSITNTSVPVQVLLGILPDDVNPSIAETYPKEGSEGIELNPVISIKFMETINSSLKYGQIRIKDSDGNILSIKNKKIDGKVLSFELITNLEYGKTYTVEIPENAVVDMFGNANTYNSFTFTTKSEGFFKFIKRLFTKDKVDDELKDEKLQDADSIDKASVKINSLIKSVEADITIEEINEKAEKFFTDDKKSQIKNNAILNRWHDPNVEHWMRFTAPSGDNNAVIYMSGNYWATTSDTIIGKALVDYEDFKSLAKVKYLPILKEAPETAYPFVTNIYLTNSDGTVVNKVGAEKVNVHVTFNKDMNTKVEPIVTFGPDMSTTDYRITTVEDGGWISSREWVGQINITPMTGDGYQFFRVIGAQASDNPWYVSGDDRERFKFEIITSGVESMNLQAEGNGNKIKLSWFQDDFDTLAGYNVYRAESEDGYYEKINKAIIPAHIKEFEDSNVEPGKTYYYKFTVLQTDMTESDYSNVASAAAIDSILPTISHNVVTEATAYMPIKIVANVTDNVAVKNVSLHFRKTGETSYKKKDMVYLGAERYSATIEGSNATPSGIEYYIEATDGINKQTYGSSEKPNKIIIADTPKITSISPNEGPSNGGTKVIITGTNFKEGAKVKFNGVESKEVVFESSTRLSAVTPSNNPGTVEVTVENPDGKRHTFNNSFTYKTEGITVTVNSIQAKKGATIEVPVSIDYVEGLSSMEMKFNYDNELLEFVGVRSGELTNSFMSASNEIAEGQVFISMAGAESVNGRGNIAYIKMKVKKDTAVDKNSSRLDISDLQLNGGAISGEIINGSFTVSEGQYVSGYINYFGNYQGISNVDITLTSEVEKYATTTDNGGYFNIRDVYNGTYSMTASKDNENNEVNSITSYDASLILQYVVGRVSLDKYARIAADVNNDGKVNAIDAAQILSYSAGKIKLPFKGNESIWKFESDYKNITVEDYSQWVNMYGILIGDVSGNWNSYRDPEVKDSSAEFNTGIVTKNNDGTYSLPILVSMSNANLFGTDIVLTYDSTIGKPIRVEKDSYISNFGLEQKFVTKEENGIGEITISLAGANPYDTSGQLINIVFESDNVNALAATTKIKEANVNEKNVKSVVYESKDVNGDKRIDILDISEMAISYNSNSGKPTWKEKLDINKDGIIDIFDLIQVARNI